MELATLLTDMRRERVLTDLANNPRLQFGTRTRQYLGAALLPERVVTQNEYRDEEIRFRTVIASDNTRYSPPVLRQGDLVGSMLVELGESDIAREMTGKQLDALIAYLKDTIDMEGAERILSWADTVLMQALLDFNERQRWQAIVDAVVPIKIGENIKNIEYLDPPGHRFNAGGNWSNDTYDPFDDIAAAMEVLDEAGYAVGRIITSRKVTGILSKNGKIQARAGKIVLAGGDMSYQSRVRVDRAALNGLANDEMWPDIETYDLRYRTQTGTARFLKDDVTVVVGATGRDEDLDMGDEDPLRLEDTLGYVGVGRSVGEAEPGRVVRTWYHDDKPVRLEGQAWQTSLSVLSDPHALVVIKGIQ